MGQGQSTEQRCGWCLSHPDYIRYHDEEWGRPLRDADRLFELLMLEGMQAGLSWWTVLQKREHMRARFFDFSAAQLASKGQRRMNNWLADAGLIRHRGKLEALISNSRAYLAIDDFSDFIWQTVDGEPVINSFRSLQQVPASTAASEGLSKRLKKAGFRFVGPTITYAFMQSAGLVNDHLLSCPWHSIAQQANAQ